MDATLGVPPDVPPLFWIAWAIVGLVLVVAIVCAASSGAAPRDDDREMAVTDGEMHEAPGRLAPDAGARTYAAESNTGRRHPRAEDRA